MREFGISFDDLLNTPIKRFWFLVNQVNRLRAETDIRKVHIGITASSPDAVEEAINSLRSELGQVYVWKEVASQEITLRLDPVTGLDPEFDRNGLRALAAMGSLKG